MGEHHWKTAITEIKPNEVRLRGYRIDELMGRTGFAEAIWLALTGELPSREVGRLIEAIFVSSIDHGATPPSALAAHTVASTGAPINASVAAGVLSINKWHGGAIEDAMRMFYAGVERMDAEGLTFDGAAGAILDSLKAKGERAMGYGHRVHTKDPRTARLFELAKDAKLEGKFLNLALAIAEAIEKRSGKPLPLNVDGAIAAVLCELGIPPELANAFFIISRVPGLVAHAHEEVTRQKPMRVVDPKDHEYDGPSARELP
ncbi:MAG: citryl-CoA lyase [bacterium]|jgi:citrate synthase